MDAIDSLIGVEPDSFLDTIRRRKPITRDNAQASFDALFASTDLAEMSAVERAAVGYFVALLHQDQRAIGFYRKMLPDAHLAAALSAEGERAAGSGPYGSFPPGQLSKDDEPGPIYEVRDRATIGDRLTAALEHVHMLVFHLRDAAPAHMRALEAAGWSATGIVTLSQLVSFLSFQLRVAAGLRALDRNRA